MDRTEDALAFLQAATDPALVMVRALQGARFTFLPEPTPRDAAIAGAAPGR